MNTQLATLLQYSIFKEYRYLSTKLGESNRVKSVVILDSEESMNMLTSDALVFISDPALMQNEEVLQALIDQRVAAVVVKEKNAKKILKKWIKMDFDDEHQIPLLSFPNGFPIMSFTRLHLFYVEDLFNEFRKVLSDNGIEGLVKTLHELSGLRTAAFFGHNRFEEPTSFLPEDFYETKKSWEQIPVIMDFQDIHFAKNFECYRYAVDDDTNFIWLCLELRYKNILVGQIGFRNDSNRFDKDHYLLLETACKMCEDELRSVFTTRDKEEQKKGAFLEGILSGLLSEEQEIRKRAAEFDWKIGDTYQVLEIDIQSDEEYVVGNIIQLVKRYFENLFIDNLPIAIYRKSVVVLLPGGQQWNSEKLDTLFLKLDKSYPALNFNLGLGRLHVLTDFKRALEEARYAVERSIAEGMDTMDFEELGFLKLIGYRYAKEEIEVFSMRYLDSIKAFDKEHNTELLNTLALFLKTGLNYKQTADQLFLHHNTVRYRIKQIGEISGRDLQQIEDLVNFTIAMKLEGIL